MENVVRDKKKLKITRLIKAPKEMVFDAWIKPDHVKHWWGPNDFTNTINEMDVRPGGNWELVMHGPDGTDYRNKSVYVAIVPAARIVFDHVSGPKYRMEVTFEEQGRGTLLTIQMTFESEEQLDNVIKTFKADEGLKQNVDRLESYLGTLNDADNEALIIERVYNAPIAKVWDAITENEQMMKWYFNIADFKAEPGFEFSFEGGSPEKTYKHLCTVLEVIPGKKLSYSWCYEGLPGYSVVSFELFAEGRDQTRIKLTHEGIESMRVNGPDFLRASFTGGWNYIIGQALKEYVEA